MVEQLPLVLQIKILKVISWVNKSMELLNNQAYEKLNDDIKALIRQTQIGYYHREIVTK